MTDSPLRRLPDFGQSPWLDFIQRGLIESGELARLIELWGLRGVTSNPTIFEQAIAQTSDYDAEIARLAVLGRSAVEIYEALALADVRAAADLFLPLYRDSNGSDGFVSLEVSPLLARDTAGTIAEARRLWAALDRPNAMIKVPGTAECLAAIRALLVDGVNVTLLFSIARDARSLRRSRPPLVETTGHRRGGRSGTGRAGRRRHRRRARRAVRCPGRPASGGARTRA